MKYKLDDSNVDGKFVYKTGLIFREGKYEDKKFSLNKDELKRAVENFRPVPLDIEHAPSFLDGKLGTLEAVKLSDDGSELYGTAKIPVQIAELVGNDPLKVSCTWKRTDKSLAKLAVVRNPRIDDAALFAAFSKTFEGDENMKNEIKKIFDGITADFGTKTYDGKWVIQNIHDMAARTGAVCKSNEGEDDSESEFVSAEESTALQAMHDMAVENGAKCHFVDEEDDKRHDPYFGKQPGEKMSLKDKLLNFLRNVPAEQLEEAADFTAEKEAEKVETVDPTVELKQQIQQLKDELASLKEKSEFSKEEVANQETEEEAKLRLEKEELERQVSEFKEKEVDQLSAKFADKLIDEKKALPAERETLVALFKQAYLDDQSASVEFAATEQVKSRVELVEALFANTKPHNLTVEELSASGTAAALKDAEGATDDPKAYAEKLVTGYINKKNRNNK